MDSKCTFASISYLSLFNCTILNDVQSSYTLLDDRLHVLVRKRQLSYSKESYKMWYSGRTVPQVHCLKQQSLQAVSLGELVAKVFLFFDPSLNRSMGN
jgi:hypothetical protein